MVKMINFMFYIFFFTTIIKCFLKKLPSETSEKPSQKKDVSVASKGETRASQLTVREASGSPLATGGKGCMWDGSGQVKGNVPAALRSPGRDAVETQSCTVGMGLALMIARAPPNSEAGGFELSQVQQMLELSIHRLSNFTMLYLRNRNLG